MTRWGSCTPENGTIRISTRVASFPGWVLDSVILHELAHLVEPGHGKEFQAIIDRYPYAERARGFLIAAGGGWNEDDAVGVAPSKPPGENDAR
jgi:predicted metal-dependent hydrolase